MVRPMYLMLIVPRSVLLKPFLNAWLGGHHPCGSHPDLHRPEKPLDLGLDLSASHLALHLLDPVIRARLGESPAKLRPTISDQESSDLSFLIASLMSGLISLEGWPLP